MRKVQGGERRHASAARRITELEAQLSSMSKLEELERANQHLKGIVDNLRARFEVVKQETSKDMSTLRDFAEDAEGYSC